MKNIFILGVSSLMLAVPQADVQWLVAKLFRKGCWHKVTLLLLLWEIR